jgi:hypothetical protein
MKKARSLPGSRVASTISSFPQNMLRRTRKYWSIKRRTVHNGAKNIVNLDKQITQRPNSANVPLWHKKMEAFIANTVEAGWVLQQAVNDGRKTFAQKKRKREGTERKNSDGNMYMLEVISQTLSHL